MPKPIRITLRPETLAFLAACSNPNREQMNRFMNSLLRRERFRQGYPPDPPPAPPYPSDSPHRNPPIENMMLHRSGLLPWAPRRNLWP